LLSFRDIPRDGRRTDRHRQSSHIWPLSWASNNILFQPNRPISALSDLTSLVLPCSRDTDYTMNQTHTLTIQLYIAETWSLTEVNQKRLEAFHHNCLRRLLNISRKDRNEAVRETSGVTRWFGHVQLVERKLQKNKTCTALDS